MYVKALAFFCCILVFSAKIFSANYYFSNSIGKDNNTAIQAQNPETPWKTINKLNSSMHLLNPGDSILFLCGDIFSGQIILSRSGTLEQPIYFGAWGSGELPHISGAIKTDNWNKYSGNIWVSDYSKSYAPINNLFFEGESQQIGRYPNVDDPNGGYLDITSHNGNTQLSSDSLAHFPGFTGAQAVIRTTRWILDRIGIDQHDDNTIYLSNPTGYEISDGYGFFIQNHLNTLDKNGEWFADSTHSKVYLFSFGDPNSFNIDISSYPSTFSAYDEDYFIIESIKFSGSSFSNIEIKDCHNIIIRSCTIEDSGTNGILADHCNFLKIEDSKISRSNNNALKVWWCERLRVRGNEFRNSGLRAGMGSSYSAIDIYSEIRNCIIQENIIDSAGYNGILIKGDSVLIKNNVISNFCSVVDDGGGLYTYGVTGEGIDTQLKRMEANIILNGIGAGAGTDRKDYILTAGIYIDDRASHIELLNNTVSKNSIGIFLHNANTITIVGNTAYDNNKQVFFKHDGIASDYPISDCIMGNNIFFSKYDDQIVAEFSTIKNDIMEFGFFDMNYYCRPFDDDFNMVVRGKDGEAQSINLEMWQSRFGYDLNSERSPFAIPSFTVMGSNDINRIVNGTFDQNIDGWRHWSDYNNGYMQWNKSMLDFGSLELGFTQTSTDYKESLICNQKTSLGDVLAGESYILELSVISSSSSEKIGVSIRNNTSPYYYLTTRQEILANIERNEHKVLLIPDTSESDVVVDISITNEVAQVWVDNVDFRQVEIENTDIDRHVKFLYNPLNTVIGYDVSETCYDVTGKEYNTFQLEPFTSIVLMNENTFEVTQRPSLPIEKPIEIDSSESILIYPNPVESIMNIITKDVLLKYISVVDMSGRVLLMKHSFTDHSMIDVSFLPSGLYLIMVHNDKIKHGTPFVKL